MVQPELLTIIRIYIAELRMMHDACISFAIGLHIVIASYQNSHVSPVSPFMYILAIFTGHAVLCNMIKSDLC